MTEMPDQELRRVLQKGLPLVSRPYAAVAEQLGITEQQVIDRIAAFKEQGLIKRFGMVLRHRELGYSANCMVVWDIPESELEQVAQQLSGESCVTLCYQRPRRPGWPYNLFCMIHGKQRDQVKQQLRKMIDRHQLDYTHQLLFSSKRFKQRGAHYV